MKIDLKCYFPLKAAEISSMKGTCATDGALQRHRMRGLRNLICTLRERKKEREKSLKHSIKNNIMHLWQNEVEGECKCEGLTAHLCFGPLGGELLSESPLEGHRNQITKRQKNMLTTLWTSLTSQLQSELQHNNHIMNVLWIYLTLK